MAAASPSSAEHGSGVHSGALLDALTEDEQKVMRSFQHLFDDTYVWLGCVRPAMFKRFFPVCLLLQTLESFFRQISEGERNENNSRHTALKFLMARKFDEKRAQELLESHKVCVTIFVYVSFVLQSNIPF